MDEVDICIPCLLAFAPTETRELGVRKLKTFKGYTVDLRLLEFRKLEFGKPMQFIAFTSPKGKALLAQMHEKAMQQARKNLKELVKRLDTSFEKFLERVMQEKVTR